MVTLSRLGFVALLVHAATACSGSDGSSGDCPQVSGSYELGGGTCPVSSCTVSQTGCSVRIDCGGDFSASGTVGPVSGEQAPLRLENSSGSCSGSIDDIQQGKDIEAEGDCDFGDTICDFKLECVGGDCLTAGDDYGAPGDDEGSSSGGGGSPDGSAGGPTSGGGGSGGGTAPPASSAGGGTGGGTAPPEP